MYSFHSTAIGGYLYLETLLYANYHLNVQSVCMGQTKQKLRRFKILDITTRVHYTCIYMHGTQNGLKPVAIVDAHLIIQLNEYGCWAAPCEISWKQGIPLAILSRILAQSCVTLSLNYVGRGYA